MAIRQINLDDPNGLANAIAGVIHDALDELETEEQLALFDDTSNVIPIRPSWR